MAYAQRTCRRAYSSPVALSLLMSKPVWDSCGMAESSSSHLISHKTGKVNGADERRRKAKANGNRKAKLNLL